MMIETVVKTYLGSALDVPVRMEIPEKPPGSFVVVEKTGSGVDEHIKSAVIVVQSYAPTLLAAAKLNEEVKTAMQDLDDLPEICRCELNTDYNYTDMSTKQYRYQAVFDIVHY